MDESKDALCRACLELLDSCTKHHIFLTPDLAKRLSGCTSLTVEPQDGYPEHLCDGCYKKLNGFYLFKTMCVESIQRFCELLERQQKNFFEFKDKERESVSANVEPQMLHKPPKSVSSNEVLDENIRELTRSLRSSGRAPTEINTIKSLGTGSIKTRKAERNRFPLKCYEEKVNNKNEQKIAAISTHVVDDRVENSHVSSLQQIVMDVSENKIANVHFSESTRNKEEDEAAPEDEEMKINTFQNLGIKAEKTGECSYRRRSKRNMNSAFNSTDEKISAESEQKIRITSTRVSGSIMEDSHVSPLEHMKDLSDDATKNSYHNKSTENKEADDVKLQPELNKQTFCQRNSDTRKTINKSQVYQCDICPKRFFVEHRLVAHRRSHDGLMPYPCNFKGCSKGFKRRNRLNEHLKKHEGTNIRYPCGEEGCGKVYKNKPSLSMHMRKFHKKGPVLKSHVCEICGKLFNSSSMLKDHSYTHKDKSELPYPCTEFNCDRRFTSKEKLNIHRMRHAGIKNYACPYCGLRKTTRNELKIHINYHTLERTWPCRFCQHVCNSAGNLKTHVRTVHERAKDYACRFCKRTFAKPDTRKFHEMTHTGEKPNECKECGKRFIQPTALRTHSKIHLKNLVRTSTDGINISRRGTKLKHCASNSSSMSTLP